MSTEPAAPPVPAPAPARPAGRSRLAAAVRRFLFEPEYPRVALEIRPRVVGAVRMQRDRGRWVPAAAASLSLPDGALNLSMVQPNVADAAAFTEVLRAVLERTGIPRSGKIGLVLPDPVARVSILPAAEFVGKDSGEILDLLRFRLRKAVPFEMKDAQISFVTPDEPGPDAVVVAAVMARGVLESYERAVASLGFEPGLVELSGLALLGAVESTRAPGDRLVVNWDEGYVSLLLARGGHPVLVRTLAGEASSATEDVVREVANTVLYYQEKLGGSGLDSVLVRSALLPAAHAIELLQDVVGVVPEVLNPWAGIEGGDSGPQSQAVAGAAACLTGKSAS